MRSFKYKIGNIETIIPWSKPDKIQLEKWYRDFIQIPWIQDYEYWVGSSLCNVEDTWDVDRIITGEIKDYEILKNILDKSIELGFRKKQLIDIFHSNNLWHFDQPYTPTTKIRNWKYWEKYINGNLMRTVTIENCKEIIPGLYEKTYTSPSNSYLWGKKKFEQGEYNENYRLLSDILK